MRRAASALLALGLLAGAAGAQAPDQSPIPQARPGPQAPARPAARPVPDLPLVVEVRPDGSPLVLDLAPALRLPGSREPTPEATRDHLPPVPRQPPLLQPDPPEPVLEGPMAIVRAEELMTEPPPVPVIVGGWDGSAPPSRPGLEPPRRGLPGLGRPRLRLLPPDDPRPLLPPEPDAPPAYAPERGPLILPLGPEYSPYAIARALLPTLRPPGIVERAAQARVALIRGQVCDDPRLQGEVVGAIHGAGGCGIAEPVLVRSVDGIRLSEPATMDCATAEALLDWTRDGARPAVGQRGGGLAELEVMGSYTCRPRNNQAGARMSEHGRGRAVDIGAVVLADGTRISVLHDWPDPALRDMRESACGTFTTVLGPGAPFHDDHLHLDTMRGRRGAYCR